VPNGTAMRTLNLSVFLTRAPDVEGQWVGHCLDLDVVSQGDSMRHAYEMTREAVELLILDDLNAGREPTLRSAPREEWEAATRVVHSANPKLYTLSELFANEGHMHYALAPLMLGFEAVTSMHPAALQEIEAPLRAQAA